MNSSHRPPEDPVYPAAPGLPRAPSEVPGAISAARPCRGAACTKEAIERLRAEHHRLESELAEVNRQLAEKRLALCAETGAALLPDAESVASERRRTEALRLESLGALAGGLAHQFNNLLTIIAGHTGLAAAEAMPASTLAHSLEEIRLATQRAADLCRSMLDAAGHTFAVRRELEPNALLDGTLTQVGRADPGRCRLDYSPSLLVLPRVRGVAAQLQQALAALIQNAFEAVGSPQGVVRVAVHELPVEGRHALLLSSPVNPGRYLCFEVSDTGPGLAPELLPRIYEPFFTTKGVGRGLGLAVAAGVARAHGGGIGVASQEGRGATFRFYLPVVVANPGAS